MEKRKFHRVQLTAKSMLTHKNVIYRGQLENISLNGALVRFDLGIIVPQGVEYNLAIYLESEDTPLLLNVEVVCSTCAMAGVKFLSYEDDTLIRLHNLLEKISPAPDKLRTELEIIRILFANYHACKNFIPRCT